MFIIKHWGRNPWILDMWGSWGYESTESHHACCAPFSGDRTLVVALHADDPGVHQGCSLVVGSHGSHKLNLAIGMNQSN